MRHFIDIVMTYTQRLMPAARQDWAKAMRAEIGHISSPFVALAFALGCLRTAGLANLKAARWEPLGRAFLCFHITVWVGAKFFAGVILSAASQKGEIEMSALEAGIIGIAGFAYLGLALSIISRKWVGALACGLAALGLNTALLMSSIFSGLASPRTTEHLDILAFAIISEEYFIWSTVLVGGAIIWLWQTRYKEAQT